MPTALAIPAAVIIKLSGNPELITTWEQLDRIPSILMLAMALSGAYLFLLPYVIRAQRRGGGNGPSEGPRRRPQSAG